MTIRAIATTLLLLLTPLAMGEPSPAMPPHRENHVPGEQDADLAELGQRIEIMLNARDAAFDTDIFDLEGFVGRLLEDFEVDEETRREFTSGFGASFSAVTVITGSAGETSHARFLCPRHHDGSDWLLYRLWSGAVFGYVELLIEMTDGRARCPDFFVHTQASLMSDMLRHMTLTQLVTLDSRLKDRLPVSEENYCAHLAEIQQIKSLQARGERARAMALYEALPESVQRDPNCLFLRLQLAADAADYAAVLARLEPGLPATTRDILRLRGLTLAGDFAAALQAVDRIEQALGRDPYLDYQRALVHEAAGEMAPAKERLRRAIEEESDLAEAYWELVALSLGEQDYATTATLLDEIAAALQLEFNDLTKLEAYSGFVRSPAYRDWLARRAAVWTIPVFVVSYLPVRDERIDITVTGDWGESLETTRAKIERIEAETLESLEQGSRFRAYRDPDARPSLDYEVAGRLEFLEPLPTRPAGEGEAPMTDYRAIMKRIDARHLVEDRGVKEIWIFAYHGGKVGLWESNMASPFGDISNSDRNPADLPIFSRTYTVYHYNYQRSSHEAVENHTHQIEALLNHVDGRDDTPPEQWPDLLFWGKFVGSDASHKIVTQPARCGWTHYPPNAEHDYDWANPRTVESDIQDWKPDGTGTVRPVNCDLWHGNDLEWKVLWMQSLPGLDNGLHYRGRPLENWWLFVADWDLAMREERGLVQAEAR